MPGTSWTYRLVARVGTALAPVVGVIDAKVRAGNRGRQGAVDRLRAWGARGRLPDVPLVWFHASSVGECFPGRAEVGVDRLAVRPQLLQAPEHAFGLEPLADRGGVKPDQWHVG